LRQHDKSFNKTPIYSRSAGKKSGIAAGCQNLLYQESSYHTSSTIDKTVSITRGGDKEVTLPGYMLNRKGIPVTAASRYDTNAFLVRYHRSEHGDKGVQPVLISQW
jgi:hypothetical protein